MLNFLKKLWNNTIKGSVSILSLAVALFAVIYKRDNIPVLIIGISQAAIILILNIFVFGKISFEKKAGRQRDLAIENGKKCLNFIDNTINALETLEKENDAEAADILNKIRIKYEKMKNLIEKNENYK